jgi:hypothetical protein
MITWTFPATTESIFRVFRSMVEMPSGSVGVLVKIKTPAARLLREPDDAMPGIRINPIDRRLIRRASQEVRDEKCNDANKIARGGESHGMKLHLIKLLDPGRVSE